MEEKLIKGEFKYSWKRFYGNNSMQVKTIIINFEIKYAAGDAAGDFNITDTKGDQIWASEIDALMDELTDAIPIFR